MASRFGLDVLVAEDNPVNVEVAREYLAGFGCSVTAVENGALAVEALSGKLFDLVLMDCQMPLMDGYQAAAAITEKIAKPLGMTLEEAALGILTIANFNMSLAVRAVDR